MGERGIASIAVVSTGTTEQIIMDTEFAITAQDGVTRTATGSPLTTVAITTITIRHCTGTGALGLGAWHPLKKRQDLPLRPV